MLVKACVIFSSSSRRSAELLLISTSCSRWANCSTKSSSSAPCAQQGNFFRISKKLWGTSWSLFSLRYSATSWASSLTYLKDASPSQGLTLFSMWKYDVTETTSSRLWPVEYRENHLKKSKQEVMTTWEPKWLTKGHTWNCEAETQTVIGSFCCNHMCKSRALYNNVEICMFRNSGLQPYMSLHLSLVWETESEAILSPLSMISSRTEEYSITLARNHQLMQLSPMMMFQRCVPSLRELAISCHSEQLLCIKTVIKQ